MFDEILGEKSNLIETIREIDLDSKEGKLDGHAAISENNVVVELSEAMRYIIEENRKLGIVIAAQRGLIDENSKLKEIVASQTQDIAKMSRRISGMLLAAGNHLASFKDARSFMCQEFTKDPDFLRVYIDNIAMLLYDEQNWADNGLDFKDKSVRDKIAARIMGLIFN